jgi:hypothetical protein
MADALEHYKEGPAPGQGNQVFAQGIDMDYMGMLRLMLGGSGDWW